MSTDPRDQYIAQVVKGHSFLEVGGLWGVVNEKISVAYKFGATRLTIIDVSDPTSNLWNLFRDRMAQLGVKEYTMFAGDICEVDADQIDAPFDVVHCSGVLYHLPNPMRMLGVLRSITREYLILTSAITPEVVENEGGRYELPPSAVIFVPALSDTERACLKIHWERTGAVAYGLTEPTTFSIGNFAPWWWLPTSTALRAMCQAAGFQVVDSKLLWNNNALTLLLQ